jgi:hypothetical protein
MYLKRLFFFLVITVFIANCTKIDTTELGQDLIPPVDGVNTFVTDTFTITTEQGIFNDTSVLFKTDDHIIGNFSSNPSFGTTNASLYVQFNPGGQLVWPATGADIAAVNTGTTVQGLDSAFLCLGVSATATDNGLYGDTMTSITFDVYRINTTSNFVKDSTYRVANNPGLTDDNVVIGSTTFAPKDLKEFKYFSFKQLKDSVRNQIRIRLNTAGQNWVRSNWLQKDTNNVFKNRDNFVASNNGFVIKPRNNVGNCAIKVGLSANISSRFEIWYKYKTGATVDTAIQNFFFSAGNFSPWISADANYIKRDFSGSAMQTAANTTAADNLLYIESTPGSFAKIKIPSIKSFPNKMVHRAELIIEEDPTYRSLNNFYAPNRLLLDCFDTTTGTPRFKSIPSDYYYSSGNFDFAYFGGDRKNVDNLLATQRSKYVFNITKYFQGMITRNATYYDMRLYLPFDTRYYSQSLGYYSNLPPSFFNTIWPVINTPVFGRVVVGGGAHPNYKMKLRVIYSNI